MNNPSEFLAGREEIDAKATQQAAPGNEPPLGPPARAAEARKPAGPLPSLGHDDVVRAATTLRNSTVLPRIDQAAGEIALTPRNELRYQHIKPLGLGAMGTVTLVHDNDIGRKVAVKQLVSQAQTLPDVARFIREIHTVGQLEHPNIVPVYDVGVDANGQIFFVMKHIDGETLESIIDKLAAGNQAYLDRFTMDYRIELFLGVLRALQYAHDKGVIHRDIKPANIMVGTYGEVVLMDWGVAKVTSGDLKGPIGDSEDGATIGTPLFMSPEQAAGKNQELDARSDLYSATVVFHELLAVQHYLHHCNNYQQVMTAILSDRFTYSRLVFFHHPKHPVPPAELIHFVVRGLARNPDDRYQSADEMIAELQSMRDGRCRVSCPATLAKRMLGTLTRFIDRYPKLSPVIFFSALLCLIVSMSISTVFLLTRN